MTTKHGFTVEVLEFEEVHTLPATWTSERYRGLLDLLDFDEGDSVADSDLPEMAAMAAQDTGQREAADRVLSFVFGERLSAGVRQNLIDDLTDDRPWEQFADLDCQSRIFETVEFLQKAFSGEFGIPDAARVRIRIIANGKHECDWLREGPKASLLLRLLAAAMDDRATLRRLYAEQVEGTKFPEAAAIVWLSTRHDEVENDSNYSCEVDAYSSLQWFSPLRDSEGEHASDAEPDQE